MLEYTLTNKQLNKLRGLAYWCAEEAYTWERYGRNDIQEIERCQKTISGIYDECDKLCIPFWVQNTVTAWANNWRKYKTEYFEDMLEKRNITVDRKSR